MVSLSPGAQRLMKSNRSFIKIQGRGLIIKKGGGGSLTASHLRSKGRSRGGVTGASEFRQSHDIDLIQQHFK